MVHFHSGYSTIQPKNNACARRGARRSCAARTRKPLQEVKMSYFLDYLTLELKKLKSNCKKLQMAIKIIAGLKKVQEVV